MSYLNRVMIVGCLVLLVPAGCGTDEGSEGEGEVRTVFTAEGYDTGCSEQ